MARPGGVFSVIAVSAALVLLLSGCLTGVERNTQSRGDVLEGFGPIVFGMSLEQAFAAIQGNGRVEVMEGKTVLSFIQYINDIYTFDAWVWFDAQQRAESAALVSRDARKMSDSAHECAAFFGTLKQQLDRQYGRSDYTPKEHRYPDLVEIGTAYTFSDSSNVKLKMRYFPPTATNGGQKRCDIQMTFLPKWLSCDKPGSAWCDIIRVYPRGRGMR